MPRFASALQDEIRRLARKEVNALTAVTRRAAVEHRRDIATLKREVLTLKQQVNVLDTLERKRAPVQAAPASIERVRFSPKWIKARREKLNLSAESYGKLIGVSGLTIYNWEKAESKPRKDALAKLVAVKDIGRREALRRLDGLNDATRVKGALEKVKGAKRKAKRLGKSHERA